MQHFDLVASNLFRFLQCLLDVWVISSACTFDGYVSNKVWFTGIVTSLSDVRAEAFHLLAIFATVLRIGVIGVLYTLGIDQSLVSDGHCTIVRLLILLVEHAAQQDLFVFATMTEYVVDDETKIE